MGLTAIHGSVDMSNSPNTQPSTEPVDAVYLDQYRIIRGQIEHEDNLIGSRISWFVTSQSFLFSAYAIIASNIQPAGITGGTDPKHKLLTIIPTIAIATSVLILLAIASGFRAMHTLRRQFEKLAPAALPLPPVHGSGSTRLMGMAAPILLPPLFMAVWIFLLVKRLF
jgi:hypothetical protein